VIRRDGYGSTPPTQQQAPAQPPPTQSYGGYAQSYGGAAAPGAAWPTPASSARSDPGTLGLVTTILLVVGGLLSLGYAAWAFTARRGIFADFADGVRVSTDDARTSDRIDTAFVIVAGIVAVSALVLWVIAKATGRSDGGSSELAGLTVAGVGVVVALVGLVLSAGVADGGSTTEQGDKGVTATLVLGAGFTLLAIGQLMGAASRRGSARGSTGRR
jgi:hypothetical protein